jgi:8-oxo-dGTP pyrophosphatase MutT (NUDIX family)
VISLDQIRRALAAHRPGQLGDPSRPRAAVSLVLRGQPQEPELLFIERARHPEDPWSGHMAFPGGRVDPGDRDPRAAAERETLEEVGLSLVRAEALGQLDDLEGRHAGRRLPLVISAYVYHLPEAGPLAPNHEVEETLWVRLADLVDPQHHVEYPVASLAFPGIRVGDPERHVVWGLTYRFLETFLALLGSPLPDRWNERP